MPRVSVIIPTYRHPEYVLKAIESVFSQTYTDHEVIVINDGSPDNTGELLKPLSDSGRIQYIEQSNAGQAAARNRGITEAKGEFVAFLDDDDSWPPDKLAWQIEVLENSPQAVVVYGYAEIRCGNHRGRQPASTGPSGNIFSQFAQNGYIRSPGQTLIRRDHLVRIGGFDSTLWGVDDWDLWLRLTALGEFIYEDRLALIYLEHENNATLKFHKMFKNAKKVRCKHFRKIESRHLYQPSGDFVRGFVTWDGIRCVNQLLDAKQRLEAFRCIL